MKTYVDLVNETVAYYSEDVSRRATHDDGKCEYISKDGRMCAVGRCLKDPFSIEDLYGGQSVNDVLSGMPMKEVFRDEYVHLNDTKVWQELQRLHDSDSNWNYLGLTRGGKFERDRVLRVAKNADRKGNQNENQ